MAPNDIAKKNTKKEYAVNWKKVMATVFWGVRRALLLWTSFQGRKQPTVLNHQKP
jgi:hypothetical protein